MAVREVSNELPDDVELSSTVVWTLLVDRERTFTEIHKNIYIFSQQIKPTR